MDEKKYLIECKKMWEWLSSTGKSIKYQYFVAMEIPVTERPSSNCYMCEYVKQKLGTDSFGFDECIKHCLLSWTGGNCISCNSEFHKWANACTESGRRHWASEIVKLCDEALD